VVGKYRAKEGGGLLFLSLRINEIGEASTAQLQQSEKVSRNTEEHHRRACHGAQSKLKSQIDTTTHDLKRKGGRKGQKKVWEGANRNLDWLKTLVRDIGGRKGHPLNEGKKKATSPTQKNLQEGKGTYLTER